MRWELPGVPASGLPAASRPLPHDVAFYFRVTATRPHLISCWPRQGRERTPPREKVGLTGRTGCAASTGRVPGRSTRAAGHSGLRGPLSGRAPGGRPAAGPGGGRLVSRARPLSPLCASPAGQLAAGTCEIVTLDRDSSQPRRTIARQTARCACRKGQIAGTTRARPACVDGERPGTPGKAVGAPRGRPPATERSGGQASGRAVSSSTTAPAGGAGLCPWLWRSGWRERVPSERGRMDGPRGHGPRCGRGRGECGRASCRTGSPGAGVSVTRRLWLVAPRCDRRQARAGHVRPSRAVRTSCPGGAVGGAGPPPAGPRQRGRAVGTGPGTALLSSHLRCSLGAGLQTRRWERSHEPSKGAGPPLPGPQRGSACRGGGWAKGGHPGPCADRGRAGCRPHADAPAVLGAQWRGRELSAWGRLAGGLGGAGKAPQEGAS